MKWNERWAWSGTQISWPQSMALTVASCCLEHLWDSLSWCHRGLLYLLPHGVATLSISGQPREMAAEMMARGIYCLDSHTSWTLTFSCMGHAYCKESQGYQFFTTYSHFSFNLASSLLFILCPYTASGCLWTKVPCCCSLTLAVPQVPVFLFLLFQGKSYTRIKLF